MFPTTWYQIYYQTAKIGTILVFWKLPTIFKGKTLRREKDIARCIDCPSDR